MPITPITYDDFMEWLDEDLRAEWVDGDIVVASPANLDHQNLIGFLYTALLWYTNASGVGGTVLVAPFQMKLARVGREPDVIYVAPQHLDRFHPTYLDGPADLVVEIVSPDSVTRDRVEKLREYQEAGVQEYWLLDPTRREARFYRMDSDRRYRPMAVDAEGIYRTAVIPGFWLREQWLWQPPLTDVPAVLREIEGGAANRVV